MRNVEKETEVYETDSEKWRQFSQQMFILHLMVAS